MFKLVVLTALLALAAAEPSTLFYGPAAYSTVLAPASTTITKQASSVVHPSPPLVYSSPLAYTHFIKKRSIAALPTYYASAYIRAPLAHTYTAPLVHSTPLIHSAPILPAAHLPYAAAHLIKKRSAQFIPGVVAPTSYAAAAPLVASTYTAAPLQATTLHATPLISSAHLISHPITYNPHFIKKRSAPLLTTYAALPTSYSHQSRVDYTHTSPYITTYSSPIAYSTPLALSHVL